MRRHVLALITAVAVAGSPVAAARALAVVGPMAVNDSFQTDEDTQLVVAPADGVLNNDGTAGSGNELCAVVLDTSGLHGSVSLMPDGSFTYTPSANYHGDGAGNSFTYTMHEVATGDPCTGGTSSTATVEITVNSVNDAPTAKADTFQALKNQTLVINAPGVLLNDTDIDGDSLTAVKVNNPTHGVVILASDGSFSYTPTTNFTGTDTFSYKASDGPAQSSTKVVTIRVSSIPPINTPTPAPTPVPTPVPTPTPVITAPPEVTLDPGASPTQFVPPTPQLSGAPTAGASGASLAPGQTADPGNASGGGFGSPLTILLGILLLALLGGAAAAMYGPRWLESRRNREP